MAVSRRQKVIIILLLIYWPGLFVLTHIPIPDVVRKAGVSDKALHFVVYLVLAFLLWSAVNPYKKVSWRRATVWWVLLAVSGYGLIDELLQKYVAGRSCVLADFLANVAGVLTSLVVLSVLEFWTASMVITGGSIFVLTNLTRVSPADLLPITNTAFHLFAYALFTLLWVRCTWRLSFSRKAKLTWWAAALAGPVGLLVAAKLAAFIMGRSLEVFAVVASCVGIVGVLGTIFLVGLLRQRWAAVCRCGPRDELRG